MSGFRKIVNMVKKAHASAFGFGKWDGMSDAQKGNAVMILVQQLDAIG